jgi:hypothetical protein
MPCTPARKPAVPTVFEVADPVPLAGAVSLSMLARFRRWMAAEGCTVDVRRLCLDRLYAFECLSRAHTSASGSLRALAVELFAAYEYGAPRPSAG